MTIHTLPQVSAFPLPKGQDLLTRQLPFSIEAEQALLGALIINNDTYFRMSDILMPESFYEKTHQKIYEVASDLIRNGKVATLITLKTFLEDEDLGGLTLGQYLARLAAEATTVINAFDYACMIRDLALRRKLINLGEEMVNTAYGVNLEHKPEEQIEDAERKLYALAHTQQTLGGFQRFSDALGTAISMAASAYKRDGHLAGISTGLADLDRMMGGLQPSDLIVLAGRPGMGKTALATTIGTHIARHWQGEKTETGTTRTINGGVVGFFSLEMSSEQLATRIISEMTSIPSHKIRRGSIGETEFFKMSEMAKTLQSIPFYIDQTGGLSIAKLTTRARRLKRQYGLDVLIVDYIQLLSGSGRRTDNRVQELTEITTGLKALAKELNVPIIACSQLSRQVEQRDDKKPQLSDLRESGSIEQDADVVLFVFREEYYVANKKPREGTEEFFKWESQMTELHGKAEVIIGKQRHGPTGSVTLQFDADLTRFSNYADESRLPEF
jgi:replicative DNA helicase